MALFLAFTLSNEEKQKLKIISDYFKYHSSCDRYEDCSAFHITLRKMLDDETRIKDVINIMDTWKKNYTHNTIEVFATSLNRFENKNIVDWIGMSETLPLYRIKNEMEETAKALNIKLDKENFSYTPHITLAFNATLDSDIETKFIPIPIKINTITLWAYNSMIENVHIASTIHEIKI